MCSWYNFREKKLNYTKFFWHSICKIIDMKRIAIILGFVMSLSLCPFTKSFAQVNYHVGIGLRGGGYENGLTVKYLTNPSTAYEGIVGFRPGVFVVTGLYEKYSTAFKEPSLNWYYGIGAHVGGINSNQDYRRYSGDNYFYNNSSLLFGADAILGLEWEIPEIPFALSLDLHPRLELAKGPFLDIEPAISIRYTF